MFSSNKRKRYKALGINIYGGGFTLGALKHFDVLAQLEECNLGRRTFDMNFEKIFRPLDLADWPIKDLKGNVDFVFANPPCAPWSIANNHLKKTVESRFNDWRLELTEHTYKAAMEIRPDIFISESVEQAYNTGESFYEPFKKAWLRRGYAVTYFLTDAIIHGSPAARRRFHFIAHKHAIKLEPPDMTDFEPNTVRQAIGDLEFNFGEVALHEPRQDFKAYTYFIPEVKPGGRLRDAMPLDSSNYTGPRPSFLIKRFLWDSPSSTMVGFDFVHPNGSRMITVREALRLCTYPDEFLTQNAVEAVDTVIPTISTMLAGLALESIKKKQPCRREFNLIDWRPLGKPYHMQFMKKRPGIV